MFLSRCLFLVAVTGGAGVPRSGMFQVFSIQKVARRGVLFFSPIHQWSLRLSQPDNFCRSAIRTNTPCGVRYVACHVQVASLLSFLGPSRRQWCSDWCALSCSATVTFGCVCSSHVSGWLTSVEVFAAVPLGVSCFLSCGVGGCFVARWNVGAQAGCFIEAFGCRRPPNHTSRALAVGSQWHGCKCS